MKLGLVAGGGDLPRYVAQAAGDDLAAVITIAGQGDVSAFSNAVALRLGQTGHMIKTLRKAKCTHVCFAGLVKRPDFKSLKPDLKAVRHLPAAMLAAREGDDALLRFMLSLFENEGFVVISPQEICASLLMPSGQLGAISIEDAHKEDVRKACQIALQIGALDIGQGAVVTDGVVLAVEAQEGTDAMLSRVAELPLSLRGQSTTQRGVLAKMLKPTQDTRVDLPTIGVTTVQLASAAGLAGIVLEAGRAFVLDRDNVIQAADAAGIFIAGVPPAGP